MDGFDGAMERWQKRGGDQMSCKTIVRAQSAEYFLCGGLIQIAGSW